MYYAAISIGIFITIIAAIFLSGPGAFVCWILVTAAFVLSCYALDTLGKQKVIDFLGAMWATISFAFIVCSFLIWEIAGDLSWMLKQ